jgi:hypothetical protein
VTSACGRRTPALGTLGRRIPGDSRAPTRCRSVYACRPTSGGRDIPRASAAGAGAGHEVLSAYLEGVSEVMAERERETIDARGLRAGKAALDVGRDADAADRAAGAPPGRAVGVGVNEAIRRLTSTRDAGAAVRLFLLEDAVGHIGTDPARQGLADLGAATAEGGFCAALTKFVVVGTKNRG